MNLKEMSSTHSGGSVFMTALKSGVCCEACLDWALLEWLQEHNGCEGGGIAWEGDLPTMRTLKLKDLIYLISSDDEWFEDELFLEIGAVCAEYARMWYYAEPVRYGYPVECGNDSCVA